MNVENEIIELKDRMTVLESKLAAITAANVSMADTIQKYRIRQRAQPILEETTGDQHTQPVVAELTQEQEILQKGAFVRRMGEKWYILDRFGEKVAGPWRRKKVMFEQTPIKRTKRLGDGSYEILR